MGQAVLHHHAGGPCVDGDPPAPAPKMPPTDWERCCVARARGIRVGEVGWPHRVICVCRERQTLWARLRRPHLPVRPCWKGDLLPPVEESGQSCGRSGPCPPHSFHRAVVLRGGQWGGVRVTRAHTSVRWPVVGDVASWPRSKCRAPGDLGSV